MERRGVAGAKPRRCNGLSGNTLFLRGSGSSGLEKRCRRVDVCSQPGTWVEQMDVRPFLHAADHTFPSASGTFHFPRTTLAVNMNVFNLEHVRKER